MTNEMTNEEAIAYGKRVIDLGLNDETQAFCELAIKALETIPKYKDAYNKGWDDGAKATYEHLKMCEEEQEPCEDCISRKSIKQKFQEHHDFFVNAYGGFSNLPQNDKSRVDEISNCIAMVVNEPSVNPQKPNIKSLGEELRIFQNTITDEKVLIGFNMAVALCNKHLVESEG